MSQLAVMIADDDEADRMEIVRTLDETDLACDCAEAASIEEALTVCATRPFDCAIVDYRFPGRDGLDGVAALHARHPHMAVVMATGRGDEIIATEAMKRGASDYIAKTNITAKSLGRIVVNGVEKATLRRRTAQQQEELERFADVLAHDLKAPVTSIRGFATLMEHAVRTGAAGPDAIVAFCRRVLGTAERMNSLIDTLHEYTRAETHVAFAPVDMAAVMADTLSNLAQSIRDRGACVSHGDLPTVHGHAPQLVQLMQNLIGNAIKYCEAEPPTVRVTAHPDRDGFRLIGVADNGIGISQADHQRIFEPFQRLHDRSRYPGTGLGLATCRKIVERHGGAIWCESQPGRGTTFFVSLPAYRPGH